MKNNIFSFRNSYQLQLSGTAMGTPAACAYATLTYGQHEYSVILSKYETNLLYYKQYINDIFGIQLPDADNNTTTWENFEKDLNAWGVLNWVIEEPSQDANFLDLHITIQNSRIVASSYQKPMNLYLYIPPNLVHPPSCIKGLITGELKCYWSQNTPEQFQILLTNFIDRLLQRGHDISSLTPFTPKSGIHSKQTSKHKGKQQSNIKYPLLALAISPKRPREMAPKTPLR